MSYPISDAVLAQFAIKNEEIVADEWRFHLVEGRARKGRTSDIFKQPRLLAPIAHHHYVTMPTGVLEDGAEFIAENVTNVFLA
jgi:hypothetical protein